MSLSANISFNGVTVSPSAPVNDDDALVVFKEYIRVYLFNNRESMAPISKAPRVHQVIVIGSVTLSTSQENG